MRSDHEIAEPENWHVFQVAVDGRTSNLTRDSVQLRLGWHEINMARSDLNFNQEPRPLSDLRYDELADMIRIMSDLGCDEELQAFYIRVIDNRLTGATVFDLNLLA